LFLSDFVFGFPKSSYLIRNRALPIDFVSAILFLVTSAYEGKWLVPLPHHLFFPLTGGVVNALIAKLADGTEI